ncbi:MAG: DMT family transporter [Paracoccaceae bacterium]
MLNDNTKAAIFMMGSMAAFTVNDTFMKSLSGELPLFQAVFLRGLATVVILALITWRFGAFRFSLSKRDWGLIGLRSLGEMGAAYFFISALFNMPLANATAILQALPLVITLLGALIFGEALGWRRMVAIVVGFGGVLLIVRPGAEGFNHYSFYALAAVGAVALRDLATRGLSRDVPSLMIALSGAVMVAIFGGVMSTGIEWAPLHGQAVMFLAGSTVFVMVGYMLSIMVMRLGELSFVSPFRYTALVWSLLLGYLVFGDWPSGLTLLGAAIVAATGIFTLVRERMIGKRRAAGPLPLRIR